MIVTQKITTLAFQVHDGKKSDPSFCSKSEPDIVLYAVHSPQFRQGLADLARSCQKFAGLFNSSFLLFQPLFTIALLNLQPKFAEIFALRTVDFLFTFIMF